MIHSKEGTNYYDNKTFYMLSLSRSDFYLVSFTGTFQPFSAMTHFFTNACKLGIIIARILCKIFVHMKVKAQQNAQRNGAQNIAYPVIQ